MSDRPDDGAPAPKSDRPSWRNERKIEVNPPWIIQGLVGLLLAVLGFAVNGTLTDIRADMQELKNDARQSSLDRAQIRADMSALELRIRGDRFTRSDWNREAERLEREFADINVRIQELEKSHAARIGS